MTRKTRTQLGVLGVFVGLFVAVMFVVSRGESPPGAAGGPSGQPGRPAGAPGVPAVADVNLEALKAEHGAPAEPERNLFVFRQRRAAPPPPVRASEPPEAMVSPLPAGPPAPPPIALKYIGLLERAGAGKVAILSDGRGNTFHAREGETIDGRYTVIRIGADSMELSYVDGRGRQTLRLSGQ